MKEVLYILDEIVHTLQRERGCISIFLYSNRELFQARMQRQFIISDLAIQALAQKLPQWQEEKRLNQEHIQTLNRLLKLFLGLPKWREKTIN